MHQCTNAPMNFIRRLAITLGVIKSSTADRYHSED
ncbi:hypothetical protein XccvBFoX7_gp73c [Xanthomonas phage FoX7]|uniref:Uncharacterized protein n=2 Tax=Carpasinavirus XcP1 TaxID=2182344 RepID=A0A858NQ39_9CAUD|nr:hypothetical protein XccvBFoX6_gp73c [Xanthomonas phage FoX6]QJB22230.1 hypothetical protein XccvBFoX7_gp73c [Xanthomonas phage FoX7]